jgi:hypothetical protein
MTEKAREARIRRKAKRIGVRLIKHRRHVQFGEWRPAYWSATDGRGLHACLHLQFADLDELEAYLDSSPPPLAEGQLEREVMQMMDRLLDARRLDQGEDR